MTEAEKWEAVRGWVYRAALFGLFLYVMVVKPDRLVEWTPVILGLGNALATLNTKVVR